MSGIFHPLTVSNLRPETDDATSVTFDVPAKSSEVFRWRAGQHVTVRFHLEGEEHRRSYSISQPPAPNEILRITVKRVSDGLVSNHINDLITPGDVIDVMPPFGSFCLDPEARARRTYCFFAAGSGITPLFAMIGSVLRAEPNSVAHLLYGNKNGDTIIFRDRLSVLETEADGRLTVSHVLSAPSLWSAIDYWRRGKIDAKAVKAFIDAHPPYAQDTQYYICGPGGMNPAVSSALMDLDVPVGRIHTESYGGEVEQDTSVEGIAAKASVKLTGRTIPVQIGAGQTVLEAARAAGGDPPFSCLSGVCGACRARLLDGEVHLRSRMALSDEDIAAGAILACQAVARTPSLSISFD